MFQSFATIAEYIVLKTGILLNKSSINLSIRLPKDNDKPPTIVINITEN